MTRSKSGSQRKNTNGSSSSGRRYVLQQDVPRRAVTDAMRVAKAIVDNYGGEASTPVAVADAMECTPSGGTFREICGASIAYGFTDGGAKSSAISVQPLGKRVAAPLSENDDQEAIREAVLKPRVVRDFLQKYDGSRLPSKKIAFNVLETMGVPKDRAPDCYEIIVQNAEIAGFLREIKGAHYVELDATPAPNPANGNTPKTENEADDDQEAVSVASREARNEPLKSDVDRVFITHGKNQGIVEQIKEILSFGNFTPVVAKEQEALAEPVPDKVMADMRGCDAAIIHVGAEAELLDKEGNVHRTLNENVLIEIGAAMALYGRKFILLVEQGVSLPSNLSGLYEVRYEGTQLDYEATMRLLRALTKFRDKGTNEED